MKEVLFEKLKESISSTLPIIVIVLVLNFTVAPMPFSVRGLFLIGSVLLIIGLAVFSLGADVAMMPIGDHLGNYLSGSRKIWLIVIASLLIGTFVTIAEPDLQVLSKQVPGVPPALLVITVAAGMGIFLVVAMLRIVFKWSLQKVLIIFYVCVMVLGIFVLEDYIPVAFDSSGVTTGPLSVPFILAFGIGVAAVRGGDSRDDSFGLVGISSLGPIYAVMLLALIFKPEKTEYVSEPITELSGAGDVFRSFAQAFPMYMEELALAILPLVVAFFVFQIFALKLPASTVIRIVFGLVYTYLGIVIFITGVNVGFLPAGRFIGETLGNLDYNWILVPIGAIMGFFVVLAEPAVRVLVDQVEELTDGAIQKKVMTRALSISIALSVALAMIRVLTGLSIWWVIIPGFGLALVLTKFSPKIFTAVAFDSGGVASGPMAATFMLPFTIGACEAAGGNVMLDAFGIVAFVAMTPLFTIQIVGVVYKRKAAMAANEETEAIEHITHDIEEEMIAERWGRAEYSDEDGRFDAEVDMDYAASQEWAEVVIGDQFAHDIAKDNDYIDFDLLERERRASVIYNYDDEDVDDDDEEEYEYEYEYYD